MFFFFLNQGGVLQKTKSNALATCTSKWW